jgi:hypothetical protein
MSRIPVTRGLTPAVAAEVQSPAGMAMAEGGAVPKPADIVFRTDASGNLAEVAGPDPKRTFVAFCLHDSHAGRLSPVAIAAAVPPHTGVRIGIIRDLTDLTIPRSVRIRRDARSQRWVIGDGATPISLDRAPDLPPGVETTPL